MPNHSWTVQQKERMVSMESKLRILYLLKILEQRTDEEHPLSTNGLIEILKDEYNISTYRTTVSKDIASSASVCRGCSDDSLYAV